MMKIIPISISCTLKYVTLKAKEVVGHNPKRAINSRVFVNPGIYSCAVDAFLEVSTHSYSH